MKRCSTCRLFKEFSLFRKNKSSKDGFQNVCKYCHSKYCRVWKKNNPEAVSKHMRANYVKNIEEWRAYTREYNRLNPGKAAINTKRRQKSLLDRIPSWLTGSDWIEINWAYFLAKEKTKETGINYQVDHIIPLQGKIVSGLHCPQNLRVITAEDNMRKGKRY